MERIDELRLAAREERGLRTILYEEQSRSDVSTFENCWSPGREYNYYRTIMVRSVLCSRQLPYCRMKLYR
jgi:hypothetical protein